MFALQRMTLTLAALALAAAAGLSAGCSKSEPSTAEGANASQATSPNGDTANASTPADPPARAAKFDPNLVPRNVVWDDPVKQREWEARQSQQRAASLQQGAQPAPTPAGAPAR